MAKPESVTTTRSTRSSPDWRYLGLTRATGEENMRLDQTLLEVAERGEGDSPTLRLYTWSQPAVSLGLNQTSTTVVNQSEIERLNYDVVRRPTGGQALLHKGDLCYALVARREWHREFRTLTTTYRAIGTALRLALTKLGVESTSESRSSGSQHEQNSPCFAMASPFELAVGGRKICGSSQRRLKSAFLQHGSLRVEDCWTDSDLQAIWPQKFGVDGKAITSVAAQLGAIPGLDQVESAILAAFAEQFQVEIRCEKRD